MLPVHRGGAVLYQSPASDVQLLHLVEPSADHRPDRRLEHGRQAGEHGSVHRVGFGLAADRLGEAARLARVDLAERQPRFSQLAFEAVVVGPGGFEGQARDRDLGQPGDQDATALGRIGEPAG